MDGRYEKAYAKINFEKGKLSICGDIGRRCSGQCVNEIREGKPSEGWDNEMLQKFCDIWDEWHLNDMRPYCSHQKELGWDKLAEKKVTLYYYTMTLDAISKQNAAKKAAVEALKRGESFTPTEEQTFYAALPYDVVKPEEWEDPNYNPRKPLYAADRGPTETKALGWLYPTDHPDGILTKPCPVCGYKYGTAYQKEEVPKDVIDWLFSLPEADTKPSWV